MQKLKYLIVGQGLAGTMLSFMFTKKHISHKVIAAKTLPSASGVAAGIYNPLVFRRLTKSWMIDELLPEMIDAYKSLELLLDTKLLYTKPIAKLIHPNERQFWMDRIESQHLQSYFNGFKKPDDVSGLKSTFDLALITNSGYVDLTELMGKYHTYLEKNNSLIVEDFNYADLQFTDTEVNWKGIKAEKIIFCEGSFAINNPFFPANIFYLAKGDVLTVKIPNLSEKYILNKDVFILPKGNQRFLIGSTYERENLTWKPEPKNAKLLLEKAQNLIELPIKLINHAVGIRPTVRDRRPVLGLHPIHNSLAFFNGLGTKGVMLAPYFANELLCLLENKNHHLAKEVDLNRFV
jgi:hypothetical protein